MTVTVTGYMSKPIKKSDLTLVLNGLLKVWRTGAVIRRAEAETIIKNSNVKKALEEVPSNIKKVLPSDMENTIQRASMVSVGLRQFASVAPKYLFPSEDVNKSQMVGVSMSMEEEILDIRAEDLEGMYIQSLGVEILQQNEDGKRFEEDEGQGSTKEEDLPNRYKGKPAKDSLMAALVEETIKTQTEGSSSHNPAFMHASVVGNPVRGSSAEPEPRQFEPPPPPSVLSPEIPRPKAEERIPKFINDQLRTESQPKVMIKPLSKKRPVSQLGEASKQRKVPATRLSRLVSYGGLAAGLGFGAIAEVTKRSLGLVNPNEGGSILDSNPFLSEANAARIVDTLCQVRGAALKIGQILSLSDNTMINPQLQKAFERVRNAADFMPDWQMEKMLVSELGRDWRSKVLEFDSKPFAAASIGQVHLAKLHDGRPIAIKIQYPGVAQGINSDIDNLMAVLNVWNIIPQGVFIDKIITVAKRELAWEVDYIREAKCAKKFKNLLEPYPDYYVPDVIDELTTKQVYSTELIEGIPVDQCVHLDQATRDRICYLMLDLYFRELCEFQFMQTDPNWSNFLYNKETKQIGLLDFGSSRSYKNSFVDNYFHILRGAAKADRTAIIEHSKNIGFLAGYESKTMENAHVDAVLLLGEGFRQGDKPYDFGNQDITRRIQQLVPVMIKERLVPPPEEIYSLHRKLSGIFLLCTRLKGRVKCLDIFERIQKNYVFGRPDVEQEL